LSSYQVLARKWRPTKFSDVKGQDHIVQTLKNAIKNNRIAHAYLFSGSRGVGKTSIARIFAKALCCENLIDFEPCNKCTPCIEITNSSSMDVQEIDGASNNKVENIHELRENIVYPPISAKYKIYIIDEVHMFSNSAFNALLKTLEEPPAHAIFMFATTEPQNILQTIISRCQRFDLKKITIEDIVATLSEIAKKEAYKITDQALYAIARESKGSMRDSQSILDQVVAFSSDAIDIKDVESILGLVDRNTVYDLVKSIINSDVNTAIAKIKKLYGEACDEKLTIKTMMEIFRNLLFVTVGITDLLASELPDYEINELKSISKKLKSIDAEQWFYMASQISDEVSRSSNPFLMLEVGIISMCNKPSSESLSALLKLPQNVAAPTAQKQVAQVAPVQQKIVTEEKKSLN